MFFWCALDPVLELARKAARERTGGPGKAVDAATLGQWLTHDGAAWPGRLTRLLAGLADFCVVEGSVVRFLDGSPRPVAATAPSAPPPMWMDEPLFLAFVRDLPDRRSFIDLQTLQLAEVPVVDGAPAAPVADTPLRYLAVPTVPTAEQLDHACAFFTDRGMDAVAAQLRAAGHGWPRAGARLVDARLWDELLDARREMIVARAVAWMKSHDLPIGRYVRPRVEPRPAPAGDLRGVVHRCVDLMTDEELAALPIPARVVGVVAGG